MGTGVRHRVLELERQAALEEQQRKVRHTDFCPHVPPVLSEVVCFFGGGGGGCPCINVVLPTLNGAFPSVNVGVPGRYWWRGGGGLEVQVPALPRSVPPSPLECSKCLGSFCGLVPDDAHAHVATHGAKPDGADMYTRAASSWYVARRRGTACSRDLPAWSGGGPAEGADARDVGDAAREHYSLVLAIFEACEDALVN